MCFINGEGARVYGLKTADERRAAVLKQLAGWFGKEAMEPIEYLEKDWAADPYTNGCPVGP